MSPDFDSICDEFEKHWKDRTPPPIEDFLEGVESDLVSDLLWELIQIELWWRHQQSRLPSLESFQERFSNHQDAVIRAFDAFHTRTLGQQGQVDVSPKLCPSMGEPNDELDAKLAAAGDAADDGNESFEQDPKAPDAKSDGKPGAVKPGTASEKITVRVGDLSLIHI